MELHLLCLERYKIFWVKLPLQKRIYGKLKFRKTFRHSYHQHLKNSVVQQNFTASYGDSRHLCKRRIRSYCSPHSGSAWRLWKNILKGALHYISKASEHVLHLLGSFIAYIGKRSESGDIGEIAYEKISSRCEDFDAVVCSGGDGTLNEAIKALMTSGKRVPLGYIPSGTMNDFWIQTKAFS